MASALARRYAEACFAVAKEQGTVDEVARALDRCATLFGDPRVESVLANPRVPTADRLDLVLGILQGLPEAARNLARLLVQRGRGHLAADIAAEFRVMVQAESGITHAVVTAARPLDDGLRRGIEEALAARLGTPVQVETVEDASIIGGLVIRIRDRVIDDSVRTHLQQLQAAMA
jgi:F-type H+-transporting ATPase subunit delta